MDTSSKKYKKTFNKAVLFNIAIVGVVLSITLVVNYVIFVGYDKSRTTIWLLGFIIILAIYIAISKVRNALLFFLLDDTLNKLDNNKSIDYSHFPKFLLNASGKGYLKFYNRLEELLDLAIESGRKVSENKGEEKTINNLIVSLENPSNNIVNLIEKLDGTSDKEILDKLEKEEIELKLSIEKLFECSKILSRKLEVERTNIDIVSIIKNTIEDMKDSLTNNELIFECEYDNLYVYGDGEKIWLSLKYLIQNAIKHSQDKSRIFIEVIPERSDKYDMFSKVYINIKNTSKHILKGTSDGIEIKAVRKLIEVQSGELNIVKDGDLFKSIITLEYGGEKDANI
ncbi:sensor histidine kinase [Clostridium baratii]|uniref:sensor histidine kinase n=1 Tax=Clostridium baratii TaxID=1561 RepID=UPI0006BA86B3|nr:sensor histidine kinase [Clostridium baratii]